MDARFNQIDTRLDALTEVTMQIRDAVLRLSRDALVLASSTRRARHASGSVGTRPIGLIP